SAATLPPPPGPTALAETPSAPGAPSTFQAAGKGGLLGPYADLGMQLNLRFELKADQFRNLRCTSVEQQVALSGCSGGFPTISPNPQYALRTAGVVGRRLHINVDFDSQREFDANNNLQVWYEGLEDEVLRRVEAGNVTFQAPASRFISAAIPASDILTLAQTTRPDRLTVGSLPVYRRRAILPGPSSNQNAGGVRAVACGAGAAGAGVTIDCTQREGPFEWAILQEGKDYYVDPTGTWLALANRLDQSDYLAVSYLPASGT